MTRTRSSQVALAAIALALGALPPAVPAQSTAPAGDARHGQAVFVSEGCYECHGYQGEGSGSRGPGGVAPNLAPHPIPYVAFIAQLRRPRERMPVYGSRILSDQAAADIYAYLVSIPPGKTASTIPALRGTATNATR
jgi:ubiquinol-cytochrome c reductase cytochrome c subunit